MRMRMLVINTTPIDARFCNRSNGRRLHDRMRINKAVGGRQAMKHWDLVLDQDSARVEFSGFSY